MRLSVTVVTNNNFQSGKQVQMTNYWFMIFVIFIFIALFEAFVNKQEDKQSSKFPTYSLYEEQWRRLAVWRNETFVQFY